MSAFLRLPWHFCTRQRACCNCRDILYVCPLSLYSDERHLRIGRRENQFSIGRRLWLLRKKSEKNQKIKNSAKNLCWQNKCGFVDIHFFRIFSLDFWEIFCEAILIHLIHGENWPEVVIASQEPTVTVREARESKSLKNQARKSFKNGRYQHVNSQ